MAADPRCWVYPALCQKWVDGDTAHVSIDVGMRMRWEGRARIVGIQAPELGQDGASEAWRYAEQLWPPGTVRVCRSVKLDSFGRPLIEVDMGTVDGFSGFANQMLATGHAVVYKPGGST